MPGPAVPAAPAAGAGGAPAPPSLPSPSFRPLPPEPPPWRRLLDAAAQRLPSWPARVAALGGAAIVIAVALVVGARGRAGAAERPSDVASGPFAASATSTPATTAPASPLVVHVAGAVAHPGVYSVPAGSRVNDALVAAGGPLPDADPDQLDLAAKLSDGDRVYVPRRGETPPPPTLTGGMGGS